MTTSWQKHTWTAYSVRFAKWYGWRDSRLSLHRFDTRDTRPVEAIPNSSRKHRLAQPALRRALEARNRG